MSAEISQSSRARGVLPVRFRHSAPISAALEQQASCQRLRQPLSRLGGCGRRVVAFPQTLGLVGRLLHVGCTATKTITIDLEAYEALRRRKGKGDSFSDVIKKHFSAGATGTELHPILETITVEEETLDRVDELIEERRAHPTGAPEL